ncbi:hypothetical protein AVEN_273187-1 [Araneus ventricosus]|uniref:DUF5641 domain-containing protein n=1 Tax=Araneus ventricosus TaxID=182803 RepID=A0A4Y1ZVA8_ARAVE|nr:hypothetical protein AVEN_273187-1 [Araneus ventricosus]
MYVDDFICGTNTEMGAIEVYHNANTIMKKASMTLTKWNSNSPVLRKEYETDKHKDSTPLCDSSSKVLGLEWDTRMDVFSFRAQDINDFIQENEQTKHARLLCRIVVQKFKKKTPPEVWNHCPGCENPSDKITRGLSVKNLVNDQVWWHGPPCLIQQDTSCVSSYDDNDPDPLSIASEERIITLATSAESVEPVLDIQKFSAPWWGGFWERLVRSVKTCLKRILGKSSLTYEELYTVLVEIEAVINSRPITYLYSNVNEPDPLSPSHFLTGSKLTVLPSPNTVPKSSKCDLIKRWKHRLLLLGHFWKRFYKEYLLELRSAMFSKIPKNSGQFKINDVVLIKEDNVKRCNWKLGRIKTLFPGRDGKIRSCEIHVANGTLRRPIERLYNLEIQD